MKELARSWLERQCKATPGASRGVVFLGAPDRGPYTPTALWPEGGKLTPPLAEAAEYAMSERRGLVRPPEPEEVEEGRPGRDVIALPFQIDGALWGAAAIEMRHRPKTEQQGVLQLLGWGLQWLELLVRERTESHRAPLVPVVELVALALEHDRFQSAATAVATEIATRFGFERVSLGFRSGSQTELRAISHSARFGKSSNLVREIEAAMDEALDQGTTIAHPPPPEGEPLVARAHQTLARHGGSGGGGACTVPLTAGDRVIGALTLERAGKGPLTVETLAVCEHAASLLGPILELRRLEDRSLATKLAASLREQAGKLVGPGHVGTKLATLGVALTLLFLALARGDHRVTADATLEGTVQRVVTAAMDGFVLEAPLRAGDVVQEGQLLAALDDKDLVLEHSRWVGQREQTLREYREALAAHDRAEASILSARVAQANAQIQLLEEQITRARLVAPFAGIVVEGDLSQSLGSPVERGEVLFEVAPLDAYRIVLAVDERDISDVAVGQKGQLALSSLPRERLAFEVERIEPVSNAEDGQNAFRVEARLEQPSDLLRPGMEGVAKVEVGRRRWLWIWTHDLVDGLRLRLWTWLP
jgi:multidrug resistance efflux pump